MKIGNLDISSFKVGAADCSIYLGNVKLYPAEEPPTPAFNGKWKATYTGGTTSSAECDSSSAITYEEITLTDLVSVQIGDCVTNIGSLAFNGCRSLTNITIPNSVTSIGNGAFSSCYSLTSVTIPSGVTSYGDGSTFYQCSGLTSVTINCEEVIAWFSGNTSIREVVIGNNAKNINQSAFYGCGGITSVTIGSGVTSIGQYAFRNCRALTSVTIPDSVASISNYAFRDCTGFTSIKIMATIPPTLGGSGVFNNTNNCPIYVPASSVSAYQSASRWSSYASRIQAIPT